MTTGTKVYRISGCGVSLICEEGQTMLWWISYMIDRGGAPEIQRIASGVTLQEAA